LALDLDGTVRQGKNGGFINHPDDVEIIPGVEPIIWRWRRAGYIVAGITNQGGVAHGFMTPELADQGILQTTQLFDENPFHLIKSAYHDAAGKVEPYCHRSLLRKPDMGMLVLIEYELHATFGIVADWDQSLMVGDRPEDQECAKRAGIDFHWAKDFFDPQKQEVIEVRI